MTLDSFLGDVDQAADYLYQHLNTFPRHRLENILQGSKLSAVFQEGVYGLIQKDNEITASVIEDYTRQFVKEVLGPFIDLCGMQLEQKQDAGLVVYHVFAHFWEGGERYSFSSAINLVKKGLVFYGQEAKLHVDIAYNYLKEMQRAHQKQNWCAVLANARMGEHYLKEGLLLEPGYESKFVQKLQNSREKHVAFAEEQLLKRTKKN